MSFTSYLYRPTPTAAVAPPAPAAPAAGQVLYTGWQNAPRAALYTGWSGAPSSAIYQSVNSSNPAALYTGWSGAPNAAAGGGLYTGWAPVPDGTKGSAHSSSSSSSSGSVNYSSGSPDVAKWSSLIHSTSQQTGVPEDVLAAIMDMESSGNPNARSTQGAMGLMQVMPDHFGQGQNGMDPATNLLAGAQYLKQMHDAELKAGVTDDGDAWAYAAGGYLNNDPMWWRDANGSQDAYGTDAAAYSTKFKKLRSQYQSTASSAAPSAGGKSKFGAIFNNQHYDITQPYGPSDLSGEPAYDGYAHYHEGLDIGDPMDTGLYAPGSYTIDALDTTGGLGNHVVLRDQNGYTIELGHMDKFAPGLSVGMQVDPGMLLGYSGSTGYSTGPHTHVQVMDSNGNPVDPNNYFDMTGW